MKALVLSLFIAFSGSIASAACSLAAGTAHSKNGALTRSSVRSTQINTQSVAKVSNGAGNADQRRN